MDFSRFFVLFLEGFGNNLLITLLSILFPLGLGILFTFLCAKNRTLEKVFHWISLPFECICPLVIIIALYFIAIPTTQTALLPVVIGFSLSFLGYMPARFNRSMSAGRNIAYNGLGLVSAIFKWSFCAGYVGYVDLLKASEVARSRTYIPSYALIPVVASFIVIAVIEIVRRIIKNSAK